MTGGRRAILAVLAAGSVLTGAQCARASSPPPSASVVLRGATRATETTARNVRADVSLRTRDVGHGITTELSMTGDCAMSHGSYQSQYVTRGTLDINGRPLAFNGSFITISQKTQVRTWERSPATHNKWRLASVDRGSVGIYVCPIEVLSALARSGPATNPAAAFVNAGAQVQHGAPVWHLRSPTVDLYIDRRYGSLLSLTAVYNQARIHEISTVTYHAIKMMQPITAPRT